MKHIISILMENESGALSRVSGLFSARGYNIESLSVAPTDDPSLSRMTLVTHGSDEIVEQITKQLNKLVDVVKLLDLTDNQHLEREMLLLKVSVKEGHREHIKHMTDIFRAKILNVSPESYVIELTGTNEKMTAFTDAISPAKVLEVVRSGPLGITTGSKVLRA